MSSALARTILCCGLAVALSNAGVSSAQTVLGKAVTATIADEIGVNSFAITVPSNSTAPVVNGRWVQFDNSTNFDDGFGYMAIDNGNEDENAVDPMPNFDFVDSSNNGATETGVGVIVDSDLDTFFGVQDLVNAKNPDSEAYIATWVFDITGASGALELGVDLAAMGDFEDPPSDEYRFEYSLDGTNFTTAFVTDTFDFETVYSTVSGSFVNEIDQAVEGQDASELPQELVYEFASGRLIALNDPLTVDGVFLNNEFQTFAANLGETTSNELTVRFTAATNGGGEAFVFRNLTVTDGAVEPVLAGDYNDDGTVDAADYTIWADGGTLLNETATPGSVTQEDYDAWAANYGASNVPQATSVPEPAAAMLALFAGLGLVAGRRS